MTSSISWIEPEGLAQTLARVNRGRRREDRLRLMGRTESPNPAATDEVGASRPVPEAETEIETEAEAQEFVPPEGALRDRLEAFTGWLMELSGARAAFVVDRDSMPLVDHGADSDLLTVASSFLRLVERINGKLLSPLGRSLAVELEHDLLMLIFVETTIGDYIVGYVSDRPLGHARTVFAADALRDAFEPGAHFRRPAAP